MKKLYSLLISSVLFFAAIKSEAQPIAEFTFTTTPVCYGTVVQFFDSSCCNIVSWFWNLGNGINMTQQNPSMTYFPGVYLVTLTVTDTGGLADTATTWLVIDTSFGNQISVTGTVVNILCNGSNTGTINTSVNGAPPFSYIWSNGATIPDLANLAAGNYSVTVTDSTGCWGTQTFSVTQPPLLTANAGIDATICIYSSYMMNPNVTGGTPPYTFLWSPSSSLNNPNVFNPVASPTNTTTYTFSVVDANGCSSSDAMTLNVTNQLTVTFNTTNQSCWGLNDGTICAVTSGGVQPYSYNWSNGATPSCIMGLTPGSYTVTVVDNNGCTGVGTSSVFPGNLISFTTSTTPSSCGTSTGTATVHVTSPGSYSYLWNSSPIQTDSTAINLAAGFYQCEIEDLINGCLDTAYVSISDSNSNIVLSATTTNAICTSATGSIDLTVSNGNPSYTFLWSNSSITEDITNLTSGNYFVIVTDNSGCVEVDSFTVVSNNSTNIILSADTTNAYCQSATGAIDLIISGNGLAPYQFIWSNGATSEDINNITSGSYFVTVTDANGCNENSLVIVGSTANTISLSTVITSACMGYSSGEINLSVNGGNPPFTFVWSNGATVEDLVNVPVGYYAVTVTDANQCYDITAGYVYSNPTCYVNISGHVFQDLDSDCIQDGGENNLQSMFINYTPGGASYSNSYGNYSALLLPDIYHVEISPSAPYWYLNDTCPVSGDYIDTLDFPGMSATNDFAMFAIPWQDLAVTLSCGIARPGFNQNVTMNVFNYSSYPMSGYVTLIYDSQSVYVTSAITPDTIDVANRKLSWNFSNINSGQSMYYGITMAIPSNIPLGVPITHEAMVYPLVGDMVPANNEASCTRITTLSQDPNMITVDPNGLDGSGDILQSQNQMHYTIFFQNTGTDTAFNIVVRDTLPDQLAPFSFYQTGTSHDCSINLDGDSILVFTFPNILLADSNINEPASHGYVSYHISHDGTLSTGTTIENRAGIYFDFNAVVMTNTALNTIVEPDAIQEPYVIGDVILIYPNPADQFAIISYPLSANENAELKVFDLMGKEIYTTSFTANCKLPTANWSSGVYFVRVQTENQYWIGKLVVE